MQLPADLRNMGGKKNKKKNFIDTTVTSKKATKTAQSRTEVKICNKVTLTRSEEMWLETKFPGRLPPQLLHLLSSFELVHLQQRRAVVLHLLHVLTAPVKEAQQLVVHHVAVLHTWKRWNEGHFRMNEALRSCARWSTPDLSGPTSPPGKPPRC